jgi:beta-N-acetylhexosaminidase
MQPTFLGLAGTALTDDERALFRAADPAGYILFRRNIDTPDQVRALTAALTDLAGRPLPILIDQEGGRVARLHPPHWPVFPAGAVFGDAYERAPITAIEACRLNALALATMLRGLGITVDCLPLLDVRDADGHDIIGDRAYGFEPLRVAALGKATLAGLAAGTSPAMAAPLRTVTSNCPSSPPAATNWNAISRPSAASPTHRWR